MSVGDGVKMLISGVQSPYKQQSKAKNTAEGVQAEKERRSRIGQAYRSGGDV